MEERCKCNGFLIYDADERAVRGHENIGRGDVAVVEYGVFMADRQEAWEDRSNTRYHGLDVFVVLEIVFVGEIEFAGEILRELNTRVDVVLTTGEGAAWDVEFNIVVLEEGWEDSFADDCPGNIRTFPGGIITPHRTLISNPLDKLATQLESSYIYLSRLQKSSVRHAKP